MFTGIYLLSITSALYMCGVNAVTTRYDNSPATTHVATQSTRVQTEDSGTSRVVTSSQDTGTARVITSGAADTGITAGLAVTCFTTGARGTCSRSRTKTRTSARTTVLFPVIQTQVRLSDITADLIKQKGGTSTFVATACSQTTISNNATCIPTMASVTYSLAKSTLLYSEPGVGIVNCKINVRSATPTQTCTITQAVYAQGVVTTGAVRPTAAPLSSTTSSTFWIGTQTGYVRADL